MHAHEVDQGVIYYSLITICTIYLFVFVSFESSLCSRSNAMLINQTELCWYVFINLKLVQD